MSAPRLADGVTDGMLSAHGLDDLRNALESLRRAEAAHLAAAVKARNLIARTEVKELVGVFVARLVACFGALENVTVLEAEQWLADPKIRAMQSDDRRRLFRTFIGKAGRDIRQAEADGVDKLIDAQHVQE